MKNENADVAVLSLIGMPVSIGLCVALDGWVLSILWRWFVVPNFHLDPIRIPVAVGIACVFGLLTRRAAQKSDERTLVETLSLSVGATSLTLLIAWVAKLFI